MMLIFISGLIAAQENSIINKNEFIYNENDASIVRKDIKLKNGLNEFVNVEFDAFVFKKYVEKISFENLDDMIEKAILESMYTLKNKNTFRPISISLSAIKPDGVNITVKYTGENDFGANKDGMKIYTFNEVGDLIKKH